MADAIHGAADIAGRSLPRRPRLAPWLVPIRLDDERMELRGAQYALPLHSPLFIALYEATAPLLQSRHPITSTDPGPTQHTPAPPPPRAGLQAAYSIRRLTIFGG